MTAKDISQLRAQFDIHCTKKQLSRIAGIKFRLECLVNTLCNNAPFSQTAFSNAEKNRLVNLATAIYLAQWLENDENAAQCIHAFAAHKYELQSEAEYGTADAKEDFVKALRRAYQKLQTMQNLQHVQAESEGRSFRPEPELDYERLLDFPTLRFLDLYVQKRLRLYELLVEKKKLLGVASEKNSNNSLHDAFKIHNEMIAAAKEGTSDREYVAACIQLYKYETSFHFRLNADIAWYIKSHGVPMDSTIPSSAICYWSRYSTPSIFPGSKSLMVEHYDLLSYNKTIEYLFDPNTADTHARRAALWRELLAEVLQLIDNIDSPKDLPSWTDEDFRDAVSFFKTDYPIIEAYVPLKLDPDCSSPDSYYNYIRALYEPLNATSGMPLPTLRSAVKEARSK